MAGPPPLTGIKVLEFAGLAPVPYAGMLLADAGATVLRIDRASNTASVPTQDQLARRKTSIKVNLKSPSGQALIRRLVTVADVVIEPFRPGVMEKLNLGPADLHRLNPRLVYARMTGFRRDGRYADMAGHDINYLSVSGVLDLLGREGEKPHAPWNLLADFAGGGAVLFQGILLALLSRSQSLPGRGGDGGQGQVVEANMVDGASYLASFPRMMLGGDGSDSRGRGRNLLDGGSPFYDTYQTKDGRYMAVGALEPLFFAKLVKGLGLQGRGLEEQRYDQDTWPAMRRLFTETFLSRTRKEWEEVFDGTDACCTPVLTYGELYKSQQQQQQTHADDQTREGDQRPFAHLSANTLLAVAKSSSQAAAAGQGSPVQGEGYTGSPLTPGHGGEETLKAWMGWTRGKEYDVSSEDGGLVLSQTAKL